MVPELSLKYLNELSDDELNLKIAELQKERDLLRAEQRKIEAILKARSLINKIPSNIQKVIGSMNNGSNI